MANLSAKLASAGLCAVALCTVIVLRNELTSATAQPDLKPLAHWVFDAEPLHGKTVPDRCGQLPGTLLGAARISTDGPTPHLLLTGPDDGVMVKPRVNADAAFLPKETLSVVAWVRIDEPNDWGAFLGCFQDNGPAEFGFVAGFNNKKFYLGLTSSTTKKMTYLESQTQYVRGKWYHFAGVYDGKEMRLYINGKLESTSREQSGAILYAKNAPLVIGRYKDDNEDYPLCGAIKEVMLCGHAVEAEAIVAHFEAHRHLAEAPSVIPEGPRFLIEPYLQYVTRTSIVVMWETEEPAQAIVEYGKKYPPDQQVAVQKMVTLGEVPLTQLEPNTKYYYRVVCTDANGRKMESKILTFLTAVGMNDAYSFTVIGDTQRNPIITGKVAKLMWERRPNFVIHNGDVVNDGDQKWQWVKDLFKPCNELFGRVALFPCIGNHEKDHPYYYKYFSLPSPEYYYSFTYGNAEFFVLDTNTKRNLTPEGEQYRWLEKALAASTAQWKFCYHHHPPYSSDSDDYGNTWKGPSTEGDVRVRHFVKLYEKYNVDVVFSGHIHLYERTWPIREGKVDQKNGIVYVTSGGGGGRLEDFSPTPAFFKREGRVDYHFCYVTIHNGTFNLKAFDHEGRLFDEFSLKKD